jgi:hypothetical protein
MTGSLIGDKCSSVIFDNSKIRRFVPGYLATTPFKVGITRTVAWFDASPQRQQIDVEADRQMDKLIDAYEQGLQNAVRMFRG